MTPVPSFTCSSCDASKPLAGARRIDGALWCEDCAEVADGVDEWIAALEVSATAKTRVMHPEMLAALLEAKRQMAEDDEPTLTDGPPMDFDDEPTRVVATGGW